MQPDDQRSWFINKSAFCQIESDVLIELDPSKHERQAAGDGERHGLCLASINTTRVPSIQPDISIENEPSRPETASLHPPVPGYGGVYGRLCTCVRSHVQTITNMLP